MYKTGLRLFEIGKVFGGDFKICVLGCNSENKLIVY